MSSLQHVSTANFGREVLHSDVPVLVDFYADWCGPCRMLGPTLEKLAGEFAGRAKIVKINVDDEPELAGQFRVQSIPTLVFVADGKVAGRTTGMLPEQSLRQALSQLVGPAPAPNRRVG